MNLHAQIRRPDKTGIEGLLEGYEAQTPEEEQKLETNGVRNLALLAHLLLAGQEEIGHYEHNFLPEAIKQAEPLTPREIELFIQATIQHQDQRNYKFIVGHLITALIQQSYDAGHNDFNLRLSGLETFDNMGKRLKGTADLPLKIKIEGSAGANCGYQATNSEYWLQESRYGCGIEAQNSTFTVEKGGETCGLAAQHCTFKTPDKTTLQEMMRSVPKGNRVIFINADGKEEEKRNYDGK